jgi:uncharacterized protein YbjQ (UPF0145 family)
VRACSIDTSSRDGARAARKTDRRFTMRRGIVLVVVAALALLPGCEEYVRTQQPSYGTSEQVAAAEPAYDPRAASVLVTTDKSIARDTEIIAVFDIHTHATSEDKGFDELRRRAYALGADAVIGAEFEHGDGDEPSHLSGMAVKYCAPRPAYNPLGAIDIPSNEDDEDKGLDKMREIAREMGADEVVNVQFEHGEDGKLGHLTGLAVKYRR